MKQYKFKKKFYNVRVVYTGYFVVLIGLISIYQFMNTLNPLWAFVLLVCIYQFFNTFISLSNPEEVDLDDKFIAFKGFNSQHKYFFNEIKDFRVKEFRGSKKIYLRINKDEFSLTKGRYWIDCLYFTDGDELFEKLIKKEDEIHPDTIKAYAHRGSKPVNNSKKGD